MSEAAPETPAAPAQEQQPKAEEPATPLTVEELQAKLEEATKESRKWETRSKENHQAKTELEKQRKAAMTDAERAVSEAESRGRTAATAEFGKELAQTQFDALAGRRNPDFDSAKALEYVDLGKFLGEDGRPDTKAISAAVERLVPAPADGPPQFDGGTRTPPPAQQGMSGLIRKAAGRA
jgi:hypothetical protein